MTTKKLALLPEQRRLRERCCATPSRLSPEAAERVARDLQLLAHPVRLKVLDLLIRNAGQVCVCDIETSVPVKQPTVSHHLRLLREAGLIEGERNGLWVYYQVRKPAVAALRRRLEGTLQLLSGE